MEYYPLPPFDVISSRSYEFSPFQSKLIDDIVEFISKPNVNVELNDETKELMMNISLFVIQYFMDKFTRPNSKNIIVYTITDDKKIAYSYILNRFQLSDAFYNYIITNITRKGIFTEYWSKIDLYASFITRRSDGVVENPNDFVNLFYQPSPAETDEEIFRRDLNEARQQHQQQQQPLPPPQVANATFEHTRPDDGVRQRNVPQQPKQHNTGALQSVGYEPPPQKPKEKSE